MAALRARCRAARDDRLATRRYRDSARRARALVAVSAGRSGTVSIGVGRPPASSTGAPGDRPAPGRSPRGGPGRLTRRQADCAAGGSAIRSGVRRRGAPYDCRQRLTCVATLVPRSRQQQRQHTSATRVGRARQGQLRPWRHDLPGSARSAVGSRTPPARHGPSRTHAGPAATCTADRPCRCGPRAAALPTGHRRRQLRSFVFGASDESTSNRTRC